MTVVRRARRTLRWLAACLLWRTGGIRLAKRRLRKRGAILVLTLHRVLDDRQLARTNSLPGMVLRRATFLRAAEWMARRCEAADLSQETCGPTPGKLRIALTFDDGWHDTYAVAEPIARELGLPIAVFVCPGLLGQDSPFWPERVVTALRARRPRLREGAIESVVEELKFHDPAGRDALCREGRAAAAQHPAGSEDWTLSWGQILTMHGDGVAVGSHTQTHQILTAVEESVAVAEIREASAALESALGGPCRLFSYPNGDHSPASRELLAEAGFTRAFIVRQAPWVAETDPLAIPRVNLAEDDITGPGGGFSRALFEYKVFWKARRADTA